VSVPKATLTHIPLLPKVEASSPKLSSSQLRQDSSEASLPQAESSFDPASQGSNLWPLRHGSRALKHARSEFKSSFSDVRVLTNAPTGPSNDVFTDSLPKQHGSFQPELETALRSMDAEDAHSLILKMFDSDCPGISMADFLHAISQCSQCRLLTASSLLGTHHCPPASYIQKGDNQRHSEVPSTPQTHTIKQSKQCVILVNTMSAVTLALRKGSGGKRPTSKGRRATSPIVISSESEEI
jgi:hypothetical protein